MRRLRLGLHGADVSKRHDLPCLFTKVLSQLGQGEAGQLAHVLHPQGLCDGGTQLPPEITAA